MLAIKHTYSSPSSNFKRLLFLAGSSISLIILLSTQVGAAPVVGFNAGLIIDDSVFTNKDSMTTAQIQAFLNSKVPSCDTNGAQTSEYGGGTRAQWGQAKYGQSTFICLKDYTEGGRSSAQIIYDVSQQYNINPQVLIVLLQKEQGLVTDTWPLNIQYRSATGYGCPDTAPCDSQYYGLTNQLTWSGKMFKAIMTASPTWYTPYVVGNNYIRYSPNASCGGSTVSIQNRATQSLYNYTPYQPNADSLNAGYGDAAGDCDSHGNRNFYQYFKDWFGSTTGPAYASLITSQNLYTDSNLITPVTKIGGKYITTPNQLVYAKIEALNTGRGAWDTNGNIGTASPQDRISAFKGIDWISNQRPTRAQPNPVGPGATGTFVFSMQAPSQQWTYNESFGVVEDGKAWTSATANFPIDVVSPSTPITSNNFLGSGQTLNAGSSILSPDTYTVLSLSPDGQLRLSTNYQYVWSIPAKAGAGSKLIMQPDGNLVLYTSDMRPIWNTETSGRGASTLRIQEDGNLVIYPSSGVSWTTGTNLATSHFNYTQYEMPVGAALYVGQKLQTPDKRYTLILQGDGNLVLYNQSMKPLWASGTENKGGMVVYMQGDGNLVLYNQSMKPLWASGTDGRGGNTFYNQADGNLVIYNSSGPIWASSTNGK